MHWLNAFKLNNAELADFYEARFSPRLTTAFAAWMAIDPFANPSAPAHPFIMPEYQVAELAMADQLEAEAGQLFVEGQAANREGDRYVATTVFLAAVLFFAGIAPRIAWMPARTVLIGFAVVMLVLAAYQLATLRIAQSLNLFEIVG